MRGLGERKDPLALAIFEQQAMALGRLFTIAANFTDPDAFFVGGGVVEAAPEFRDWFLATVQANTTLRVEQLERQHDLARAGSRHGRGTGCRTGGDGARGVTRRPALIGPLVTR